MWTVELTDEFFAWWSSLREAEQDALQASIELLENQGPFLGRPTPIRSKAHGVGT